MPVTAVLFVRSYWKLRDLVLRRRKRDDKSIGGGGGEKAKNVSLWLSVPRATLTGMRMFIRGGRRSPPAAGMTAMTESMYNDESVGFPVDDVESGRAAAKGTKKAVFQPSS